jgi:uncharacterized protein (TIGR02246 family)
MRTSRHLFLLAGLLGLAGVAAAGHEGEMATPPGSAADCWLPAFEAGDADAVTACYLPDAVMYFPNGPAATGREAIREGYAGFFAAFTIKDVSVVEVGRIAHGDTLTAWGDFTITMVAKESGAETVARGRFTDVARFVDGQWRYLVDHASDAPPAPAPAPAPVPEPEPEPEPEPATNVRQE